MAPFNGLHFRPFAVYDKLKQSWAVLTFRQIERQAIGKIFMVKEFDIKLSHTAIVDYSNTDGCLCQAESLADYAHKFYELATRTRDIFEIANDMNSYALHSWYIALLVLFGRHIGRLGIGDSPVVVGREGF